MRASYGSLAHRVRGTDESERARDAIVVDRATNYRSELLSRGPISEADRLGCLFTRLMRLIADGTGSRDDASGLGGILIDTGTGRSVC